MLFFLLSKTVILSHITLVQMDKRINMLRMNPGACGFKGFHSVKTILRFSISDDRIHDLEVIELGKSVWFFILGLIILVLITDLTLKK